MTALVQQHPSGPRADRRVSGRGRYFSSGSRAVRRSPSLAPTSGKVEGIRGGLRPSTGLKAATPRATASVSYVAFVDGALPIMVAEHWDLGEYGRGEAVFHFVHGDLLRYRSRARGLSEAGAPSDGWYDRTMTIYFEPDRFVAGIGAVNGRPAEPDEHEVRAAWRQAEAVKARIAAAGAAGVARADPSRARYACADGAVFATTFDLAGGRAVVEFLGREPIVLPRVGTGSGLLYADDRHRLHGQGEEALWASGAVAPSPARSRRRRPRFAWRRGLPAVRSQGEAGRRLVPASPRSHAGDPYLPRSGGRPSAARDQGMAHEQGNGRGPPPEPRRRSPQCIAAADGDPIDRVEPLAFDAPGAAGEVTRSSRRRTGLIRAVPASATSASRWEPAAFSAGSRPGSAKSVNRRRLPSRLHGTADGVRRPDRLLSSAIGILPR